MLTCDSSVVRITEVAEDVFDSLKKACFQHRVAIRLQICSRPVGDKYPEMDFQFKTKL